MTNEIKEILKELKQHTWLEYEEMDKLLDYITNLQEENERLKEIVENLTTMTVCGDRKQIKNTAQYKLDIYKSRNEKAIEYIKQQDMKYYGAVVDNKMKIILCILQGEDKDE